MNARNLVGWSLCAHLASLINRWNGCSNMAMSIVGHGGLQSALEFFVCPYGVHEGELGFS